MSYLSPKFRKRLLSILLVIVGIGTVEVADGDVDSMPILGAILRKVTQNSTSVQTPEEDDVIEVRRR